MARPKKLKAPAVRLQFEVSQSRMDEIERLMKEGDVATKKEFLDSGIALLKWAFKNLRKGRLIVSLNDSDGSYRELDMPAFEEVRMCAEKSDTTAA